MDHSCLLVMCVNTPLLPQCDMPMDCSCQMAKHVDSASRGCVHLPLVNSFTCGLALLQPTSDMPTDHLCHWPSVSTVHPSLLVSCPLCRVPADVRASSCRPRVGTGPAARCRACPKVSDERARSKQCAGATCFRKGLFAEAG